MKSLGFCLALAALASGCGSSDATTELPTDAAVDGDAPAAETGGAGGATPDSGKEGGKDSEPDAVPTDGPPAEASATCGAIDGFLPSWAVNATPSKEVYVSPSGDDNADGSQGKPLKTAKKAFSLLAAGVRLNFATGTYDCPGFVTELMAPTTSPAIVRAIDGPRSAKFDCANTSDFFFDHVSAIVLDGLEIFNASGHGILLDSGSGFPGGTLSSDFVLAHSYVHDTQLASIKCAQSQRIYVIGNEFARIGAGRQNVEMVACDMPVIVGNDAHDSDAFDEVKGGANGGIIALNHVHDMNAGGGGILVGGDCTGQQFLVDPNVDYEAKNLVVWGNVITGADSFAFRIVGCHDCLIANNTYWSPAPKAILRILHDAFASQGGTGCDIPLHNSNVRITNNLFAWPSTSIWVTASDEDPANIKFDHNLWFASGGDVTTLGGDIPFLGEATSLYNKDPKLVSPPGDVSLGPGSAALGAGISVPEVGGTMEGKCPKSPPDIGAY
ncbi:MAG: right-handed parallel beta-helix repeat-containing protein [Deltaproteobacteria bacterium]|nr:right-handed parallel beta-helix repeat-containing protein [Deltaproteobacteria bacterium]